MYLIPRAGGERKLDEKTPASSSTAETRLCKQPVVGKQNQVLLQFITYNFSKAENPRKFAAANTPTASASVTVISLSFSYNAARARAKAEKGFFSKSHKTNSFLCSRMGW